GPGGAGAGSHGEPLSCWFAMAPRAVPPHRSQRLTSAQDSLGMSCSRVIRNRHQDRRVRNSASCQATELSGTSQGYPGAPRRYVLPVRQVDLNADLGEEVTDDASLLTLVTSANVACGYHAGTR